MAGRGVDIKLGGDPEQLAIDELRKLGVTAGDESWDSELAEHTERFREQTQAEGDKVRELGGLFICGTERHESRRIDNQLRGRSGRQGDPGESRFYLSAEDDLIRLFAGERIYKILDRLGPVDDEGEEYPLEAKMLTRTIENAQKKVEQQNFLIRKRVLEYDDVMNEQRRVVYKYRREILEGRDMSDVAHTELEEVVTRLVETYTPGEIFEDWDLGGLEAHAGSLWPLRATVTDLDPQSSNREKIVAILTEDALAAYGRREEEFGSELMRYLERQILLQIIDNRWREHLYEMDYLREGIHLRGFAQIDPLVAYKNEGFTMFRELMASIWEEFTRVIFHVEVNIEPAQAQQMFDDEQRGGGEVQYSGGEGGEQPSAIAEARSAGVAHRGRRRLPPPRGRRRATAPTSIRRPWSRPTRRRSAATIPAGAARARSTRSATAPSAAAFVSSTSLAAGPDGEPRCWWGVSAPEYVTYHDREWGRPVTDDRGIYERLTLEAFQSGLSWLTILRKREAFRAAFAGFDFARVARFGERDVERLLGDASIVRNRAKIEAAIANARAARELVAAGESLAELAWSFRPEGEPPPSGAEQLPATTDASTALAKELKRRGFRFVGPTTAYALMQAVGIVNDHIDGLRGPRRCRGGAAGGAFRRSRGAPAVTVDTPQAGAVRRFYDAFNARDLEAFVATLHPEVELQTARGLRPRPRRGAGMGDQEPIGRTRPAAGRRGAPRRRAITSSRCTASSGGGVSTTSPPPTMRWRRCSPSTAI